MLNRTSRTNTASVRFGINGRGMSSTAGRFAVQLAKRKGAHVVGSASAKNQSFLREPGVDERIDYEKTRFEDVVHDVDVVLDITEGQRQNRSWQVLKKGGILLSIAAQPSTEEASKHGVRSALLVAQADTSVLREIARLIDSGKPKPIVETVLTLSQARKAHELTKSGRARGKIVLKVA